MQQNPQGKEFINISDFTKTIFAKQYAFLGGGIIPTVKNGTELSTLHKSQSRTVPER